MYFLSIAKVAKLVLKDKPIGTFHPFGYQIKRLSACGIKSPSAGEGSRRNHGFSPDTPPP
jgi:hypothetical protein